MAKSVGSYKAIINHFNNHSASVRGYFGLLPNMVSVLPYEVTLAYLFLRTEEAQNRCLYGGVVKVHRANARVAEGAVNAQYLTRKDFLEFYERVFATPMLRQTCELLKHAQTTRDKVVHGRKVPDSEMRQAICDVLDYAEAVNAEVGSSAGFEPFGSMTGFKGAAQGLDPRTTRWLLKA